MRPVRPALAPVLLCAVVLSAACLQGARAPQVAPRGTLSPGDGEAALGRPAGPFAVVFASPKGATVDPSEITIVFNRPMRALELAGNEAVPPIKMTPAAPGHWIWNGTSGLSFNPEGHLPRATSFTVEVPAGTRALDGSALEKPFVLRFTTARPKLEIATPGDRGNDDLGPDTKLTLRFNQPVSEAEVARALTLRLDKAGKAKHGRGKPKEGQQGDEVPLAFELKRPDPKNEMLVELTPKEKLPLDSAFVLRTDKSLRGLEGPLLAEEEQSFTFRTYGPLEVRAVTCGTDTPHGKCSSDGGMSLELTNAVKFADLKKAIRVEPGIKIRWPEWLNDDSTTSSVPLWGRFAPGKTYRVSLGVVKDQHGQRLKQPFAKSMPFDDLWPTAAIGLTGRLLEPSSARGIPVATVNVGELSLATAPLDEQGVFALMADGTRDALDRVARMPGGKLETVKPAAGTNRVGTKLVQPEEVLGGKDKRGPFAIALRFQARPGTHRARAESQSLVVQLTDLGISAKVSRHGTWVWVTHLSNAAPVEGATVKIVRPGGQASSFTTDRSGFAFVPESAFTPAIAEEEKAVIFARHDGDLAYRRVSDTVNTYRIGQSIDSGPDRPFGMLFTDRGIFRPGDEVRLKGIFREEAHPGTKTPAGRPVDVTVDGPDGDTVFHQTVTLSSFGTLAATAKIPETSRLGTYAIRAKFPGADSAEVVQDFEVAEYKPAEFKVAVESSRPSYVRGDTASWTTRADYLFGAPMSGADAELQITRTPTSFVPPNLAGFDTGDSAYQSGRPYEAQPGVQLSNPSAKLDARGAATTSAKLDLAGQHGPELVSAEATVTDLSRQAIAGSTSAIVHPGEFYVALKTGNELFVKAADPVKPEIVTADPKGARVAGVKVAVELIQRRWSVAHQEVGGGFRTQSEVVDKVVSTCSVETGPKEVSCSLQPSGVGYYLVRATAKDRRGNPLAASAPLYATGDTGETSWRDSDPMAVELVPDRKSYEIGQTARVLVKSPFKSAEAWVTVERGGIFSKRKVTLAGPMPTVEVPITDELRPNAFVSVLLVRGRSKPAPKKDAADIGAPSFRMGYAALPINPEKRRLALALKTSKTEARPGDPLDVDVEVKDRAGKPARAEVTLYAVDEGVLMLTGYKTPDPIPVFGAPRDLKVWTIEAREILARVRNPFNALGLDKGLDGGDGADGKGGARRDFRQSAYWSPALVTDAAGKIHASFKLPDSLTTYRVMAVAAAEDDRFGFADERVVTSRPLMARPALPRFVRAGDTLDAGVVVTSKGLPKSRVDVALAVEGLTLQGDAKKTVELDGNGSAEVRFALQAPKAGKAKLTFHVTGGGAEDKVEVTRDVKVPLVMEAVALYGDTTKESADKLGDLSQMRDDAGGLEVSLASTALVGLGGGMEQLLEYPYGCTEQLVSKLVPMLPLRELASDYKVALPKDLDRVVNKTVADVISHQRGDGGFGLWAESPDSMPFVTAYALWGLGLASKHGVAVPKPVIDGAVRYLRASLSGMEKNEVSLAAAPFVLDVLAENDAPDPGRVTAVFEERAKLPLFSRAELLHAAVLSKVDPKALDELVSDLESHVRIDGNQARAVSNEGNGYAVLMDSEARTSALVLRGLLAARPEHALGSKLAMGLLAARRGGTWRSTQETAWSLLALDDYRRAQEKTEPDFTGRAFLGEAQILEATFKGRSFATFRAQVPAATMASAAGAPVGFSVEGQGRLFYEARLRYAKKILPKEGLERGFFVKKTYRVIKPGTLDEALKTLPEKSLEDFKGTDLVLADVVVVTPSPREFVVIDDPLPAGFEAVDARLKTTGASMNVDRAAPDDGGDEDEAAKGTSYRPSQFLREIRDDRVLFFVDHMGAGMYHYRYLARATSLGTFVVPGAKVEEMYTPEVFGRTGALTVRVGAK